MAIRREMLTGMYAHEERASKAFSKMTTRERQAYLKAHPDSKFGNGGAPRTIPNTKGAPGMRTPTRDPGGNVVSLDGMDVDSAHEHFKRIGVKTRVQRNPSSDYDRIHIPWHAGNAHDVHEAIRQQWMGDDTPMDSGGMISEYRPSGLDQLVQHVAKNPKKS